MRSPFGSIHINTGSSALVYGLLAALTAVALVVGITGFDVMRPVHYPIAQKQNSQVEHP